MTADRYTWRLTERQAAKATTPWFEVEEFAEGWRAEPGWPVRIRRNGGWVEVGGVAARTDGREPLPGERIFKIPAELLGEGWRLTWWTARAWDGGRQDETVWHVVDAEGWWRAPVPVSAPGMTDLMVSPESIDAYLAENPPGESR